MISDWQSYIIEEEDYKMISETYTRKNIEEDYFAIQWVCEIFNINI